MNKTAAWLDARDEEECRKIITKAQKDVKHLWQKYKEHQEDVQRSRRENLERERKEKERKEKERAKEMQQLCSKIESHGGLWCSPEAIDESLQKMSMGKRGEVKIQLDAIKDQINFRKKVLQQKFKSAKMASFSQNGVQFSLDEMIVKLKNIVSLIPV